MKKSNIIFLTILFACSSSSNDSLQSIETVVDNTTKDNNVVEEVLDLDNKENYVSGSFNLPPYNGNCIYSEKEALNELEELKNENNLNFVINLIYETGPPECAGKVWGASLPQGGLVDESISKIDLIVGKVDLNNQSRENELPSEYPRTSYLGAIQAEVIYDLSVFNDYVSDIDYIPDLESYLLVGHQKSTIYIANSKTDEVSPLIDLSNFIGTTENWETGLLSINPVNYENNQLYFLAGYTDKDIRVTISIFIYDFSENRVEKFKDLFISPQNANLDWLNCGNIERVNSNTWVFCVGDQDTLYALNETSLRTDLYSGKLIMFSMNNDYEVIPAITPKYNPDIFTPVGGNTRPKSVLASPVVKSKYEIEHILALGFRNPWGFAVGDGFIFAPDVGLNKVEEINFIDLTSNDPKFFGWPHKEGGYYYAKDEEGKFWDYEIEPIYQHSSEEGRCANIGGAIHKNKSLLGWNDYFFFLDQCTFEIFMINKSGDKVFRTQSESISSAPVVVKNDKFGNIIISTYTGQIFLLNLNSLDF